MYICACALTYLHCWLWAYKTCNISETVEDKAKVTINMLCDICLTYLCFYILFCVCFFVHGRNKLHINGLYKVVHGLSIAAKMFDL